MLNQNTSRKELSRHMRGGFTLMELLVASSLLLVTLSVVTQLAVQNGRLRSDVRHYRTAINELSNQMDRLTAMDKPELAEALPRLTPSDHAAQTLASPVLTAEEIEDEEGRRIVLKINWRRPGDPPPLALVGWLSSSRDTNPEASE